MTIPGLNPLGAIFVILFAAFMWGSWFQFIKHLDDYPIDGYLLHVFFFSVLLVLTVMVVLVGGTFTTIIRSRLQTDPIVIYGTLFCGAMYAIGMRINLNVMSKMGLILATAISSTGSVLVGTGISILMKSIDPNANLWLVLLAAIVLVGASMVCVYSTKMKNDELHKNDSEKKADSTTLRKAVLTLLLTSLIFAPCYTLGMSIGLESPQNLRGLPPIVFMFMLSSGAFIGIGIVCSTILIKKKLFIKSVIHAPLKVRIFGLVSAIAHYGGNIIHSFATPIVSLAISWPLGQTYNMWSYLWGLIYGEYKGTSKKVGLILALGIALYITGIVILGFALYWN